MKGCPDCERREEAARQEQKREEQRRERENRALLSLFTMISGGLLVGLAAHWIGSFFTSDSSMIGVIGVLVGAGLGIVTAYWPAWRKTGEHESPER